MRFRGVLPVLLGVLAAGVSTAQKSGSGSVGSGPGSSRTPPPNNLPSSRIEGTAPFEGSGVGSVFITGKVVMDDGSELPNNVVIERNCRGARKPLGYARTNGSFNLSLTGANSASLADASYDTELTSARVGRPNTQSVYGQGGAFGQASNGIAMAGCEIQATYAGLRSNVILLDETRGRLDNPNVGTLILHHTRATGGGNTVSATTLLAPKEATKAYDKGLDAQRKGKPQDALKEFRKATEVYPHFAAAWYELGKAEGVANRTAAKDDFEKAIAADSKFVPPYIELAGIGLATDQWEATRDLTAKAIRLDGVNFPHLYFMNAIAQYHLKNLDEAETNARRALQLDSQHRVPKALHLVAAILVQKGDLAGAREQLQAFLATSPNAEDAELTRKQLLEIETQLKAQAR